MSDASAETEEGTKSNKSNKNPAPATETTTEGPSTSRDTELTEPQQAENGGGLRRSTRACVLSRSVPYFPPTRTPKRLRMDSYQKRVSQWLDKNFHATGQNPEHLTPLQRQASLGENIPEGGLSDPMANTPSRQSRQVVRVRNRAVNSDTDTSDSD